MDKDMIIKYFELLNEYEQKKEKNESLNFTDEQSKIIASGNEYVNNNSELRKIVNLPLNERIKYIEEQRSNEKKLSEDEDTKAIQEVYGIDISKIENKRLNNGLEIIKFYSPKLERVVILQNRKDKSLAEQLKEKQAFNKEFQSDDDKNNTDNMLEAERQENDVELKMIYISDLGKYGSLIGNMSKVDRKRLDYLVDNANVLGIKKINIENLFYLDEKDNIREVVYNYDNNTVIDQEPNSLEQNVNQIDTSERVDSELSHDEQENALANSFEDNPAEIENVDDYQELTPDIQERVELFIASPELLDNLDKEEREKWERYIEIYKKQQEKGNTMSNSKQYVKTLQNPYSGTADVLYLGIISSIFIGFIILAISFLK